MFGHNDDDDDVDDEDDDKFIIHLTEVVMLI